MIYLELKFTKVVSFLCGNKMAASAPPKDITIPGLPWESDKPVQDAKDFNSPGDFMQQVSNFQFQVNATRIIFSMLPNVRLLKHDKTNLLTF